MNPAKAGSAGLKTRRIVHQAFELGVLLKGIDGGLELVGGLLLIFVSPVAITGIVSFLVQGELKEDPTDLAANLLLHTTRSINQFRIPASAFLITHGVTKLVLAVGLVLNQNWSYPAAIVIFAAFTVFQLYQLAHQYSPFLATVTVLDIVVVLLVIAEYRYVMVGGVAKRRGD